jgi:hypothetical protein
MFSEDRAPTSGTTSSVGHAIVYPTDKFPVRRIPPLFSMRASCPPPHAIRRLGASTRIGQGPSGNTTGPFQKKERVRHALVMVGKLFHNIRDESLCVAEQHQGVVHVIQRVIDAGKARIHAALDHHRGVRLLDVEHGHPVNRA